MALILELAKKIDPEHQLQDEFETILNYTGHKHYLPTTSNETVSVQSDSSTSSDEGTNHNPITPKQWAKHWVSQLTTDVFKGGDDDEGQAVPLSLLLEKKHNEAPTNLNL